MSVRTAHQSFSTPSRRPRWVQFALALGLGLLLAWGPAGFGVALAIEPFATRWVEPGGNDDNAGEFGCLRETVVDENDGSESYVYRSCRTIGEALRVAKRGDFIRVAGTGGLPTFYDEDLIIEKDITIIGGYMPGFGQVESPQNNPTTFPVVIRGVDGTSAPTIQIQTNVTSTLLPPLSMEVTLQDIGITGGSGAQGAGIRIQPRVSGTVDDVTVFSGFGDITLKNVVISGNTAAGPGGGLYVTDSGVIPVFAGQGHTIVSIAESAITGSNASNGGGAYITGNAELALEDVLIQDNQANGGSGGGIHVTGNAEVTVSGGLLDNNRANSAQGGGLYATGASAIVAMSGVTLTNNTASSGGGLAFVNSTPAQVSGLVLQENSASSQGGGVYAQGSTFTLGSSTLLTNTAPSGGGVYLNLTGASEVTLASVTLQGNTATNNGGGLHATGGSGAVIFGGDVTFAGNHAASGGGAYIENARAALTAPAFTGNTAANGGGLRLSGLAANSVLNAGNFTENSATGDGGGLYISGALILDGDPGFGDNQAARGGGLFATNATLTGASSPNFTGNQATTSGGGGFLTASTLAAQSITAAQNFAPTGGGLALADGAGLTLIGTGFFSENEASGNGGALHADNASVQLNTIAAVAFQGNKTTSGAGGALYFANHASLVANGAVNFSDNEAATGSGGAITAHQATLTFNGALNMTGNKALGGRGGAFELIAPSSAPGAAHFATTEFHNNLAGAGGAIYAEHVTLTFGPDTLFQENSAQTIQGGSGAGGALYVDGAPLHLDDITFLRNNAVAGGGAVYLAAGTFSAGPDARFQDNGVAGNDGKGGALLAEDALVALNGASFTGNQATGIGGQGGAIHVKDGPLAVTGASFSENAAVEGDGGALFVDALAASAALTQTTLTGNFAKGDGGGLHAQVDTLHITGTTFSENESEGDGGGLYARADHAAVQQSAFEENTARDGGGAYLLGPGQAQWRDNSVRGNEAHRHGGGLYLLGVTLGLESTHLGQNTAQANGGGVYAVYSRVELLNTVVAQNQTVAAQGHGGGIWAGNSELALTHATLAGHSHSAELSSAAALFVAAPQAAGAGDFAWSGASSVMVHNSIVADNQIGLYLLPGNSAALTHSLWQNSRFDWTGYGDFGPVTHNRRGDPRFFNAGQGDYRIRRDSAAFDIAAASSVTSDKAGVSREHGYAPDAGAFEHRYARGLHVDAQVSPPFARDGDTVSYTIRLRNTSAEAVTNVQFSATLPDTQPSATINGQNCAGPFCGANLGNIAAGQEVLITIAAQVQGQPPATGLGNMNVNLTIQAETGPADAYGNSDTTLAVRSYLFACRVQHNGMLYPTVQAAVDAAPSNGVVRVHGYCGDIHSNGGPRQAVALNKSVTIQGGWNSDFTLRDPATYPSTIDAGELGRVVYITGGAPTLEDINLRGGATRGPNGGLGGGLWGKDAGGGVYLLQAGATFRGVDIANSVSGDVGGGVYLRTDQTVRFERSAVRQNEATERGGGLFVAQSNPELIDMAISGNRARAGGGLYVYRSAPVIQATVAGHPNNPACRIDANQATGSILWREPLDNPTFWLGPGGGGGVFLEDSPASIVRCSLRNNQARSGAGLYLHQGHMTLQQSILTGNGVTAGALSSDGDGGALHLFAANPAALVIESNYFGFNQAARGSAIFARIRSLETVNLRHSTIAHNLGASALYAVGQSNLSVTDSIVAFNTGTSVFAAESAGGSAAIVNLNRTLWHENQTNSGSSPGQAAVITQNDFNGDPAFFDDGFRIKRISAAYGRGGSGAALADRDGDARPQGQNRDLGADEYAPAQVVRYVALNGSDANNNCLNYLTPCRTLQAALDAANSGDMIKMAGGEYTGVSARNGHTQIGYIDKAVTIQGGYYARTDNNDVTDELHTLYDWELPHPDENPTILNAGLQGRVLTIVSPGGQTIAPRLAFLELTRGQTSGLGGGVYVEGAAPIFEQVSVRENRAAQGGGFYLRNSGGEFTQLTIADNQATGEHGQGGGVYIEGGAPLLHNLTIEANRAITGAGVYAGDTGAQLTLNTIRNNGNDDTRAGGGVYLTVGATQALTNSVVGNRARAGGGLYLLHSQAEVRGNTIGENRAVGGGATGGGIYAVGGAPQLLHNTVAGNRALHDQDGRGGGLYLHESALTLAHNEFINNWASAGGGLYLQAVSGATIEHNVLRDNRADMGSLARGGGAYINGGTLALRHNTVRNNRAQRGGGLAIGCSPPVCVAGSAAPALEQNQILDNIAGEHGGGLYITQSAPQLTLNEIARNSTEQGHGAGVHLLQSDAVLTDNTVAENIASLRGGGLYLEEDRSVVRGGVIRDNRANSGGGIYFQNQPNAGIQIVSPRMEHVAITGNRAAANGGGIYARQSRARLRGLTIANNQATSDGGGVYLEESVLAEFEASLIRHNRAGARGGGLVIARGSNTLVASIAIVDNQADGDGGGVAILGASPVLAHITLARNAPNGLMANVANNQGGQTHVYNTIIAGHTLGVKAFAGVQVRLDHTLFHENGDNTSGPTDTIVAANGVSGNPAFAADGYHLMPGSAAVGAGAVLDLFIGSDIDGEARIQGTGPDLGADELTASCSVVRATNTSVVYSSVQAAIDAAGAGEEIRVAGTCTGLVTRGGRTQLAYIDKNLTLRGGYTAGAWSQADPGQFPTILDARSDNRNGRAVYIGGGAVALLENLTLLNGDATGQGGGPDNGASDAGGNLLVDGVNAVTLAGVTLRQGRADYGGGLYLRANSGSIVDGAFIANVAGQQGGGFYIEGGSGDLAVRRNLARSNDARDGGGGAVNGGQATIANNRFVHNRAISNVGDGGTPAHGQGGGLYAHESVGALINNEYFDNAARAGGALYAEGGLPLVYNNMAGRNAAQQGSAFYFHRTAVHLRHNTIVDNHSITTEGQVAAAVFYAAEGLTLDFELANNIIVGHALGLRAGPAAAGALRANLWHDNQTNWAGTVSEGQGNRMEAPGLINRAGGNYFLTPDSPAIDRGVNAGVSIDIQNRPRPGRLGFDIGADEFLEPGISATLSAVPNPVGSGQKVAFVAQVVNSGDVALVASIELALPPGLSPDDAVQYTDIQLARGGGWTQHIVATVGAGVTGDLNATLSVTTDQGVEASASTTVVAADTTGDVVDIALDSVPSPVPAGSEIEYRLRVVNHGAIPLDTNIHVELSPAITPVSDIAWTPTIAGPDGTWTTFFTGRVAADAPDLMPVTVRVTSQQGPGGQRTVMTELAKPRVTAAIESAPEQAQSGVTLTYRLTVANTGNMPLDLEVTPTFPSQIVPVDMSQGDPYALTLARDASDTREIEVTVETGYTGPLETTLRATAAQGVATTVDHVIQAARLQFAPTKTARGGLWHDAAAWEPEGVPTHEDAVLVPAEVIVTADQPIEIRDLRNEGAIILRGQSEAGVQAQQMRVARLLENGGLIRGEDGRIPGAPGTSLSIQMDSEAGSLYNTGEIRAGHGATDGGHGGAIWLTAGSLTNEGLILGGNGANVTSAGAGIGGGRGGGVFLTLEPGQLVNRGLIASGIGGRAHANADPPQAGGRGGDVILLGTSLIRLDGSEVRAGLGGAGSRSDLDGARGEIGIAAVRVSHANTVFSPEEVSIVQADDAEFGFAVLAPSLVAGHAGGPEIVALLRIFNRSATEEVYLISAVSAPVGWGFLELPATLRVPAFKSRAIAVRIRPPAAGSEAEAAGMSTLVDWPADAVDESGAIILGDEDEVAIASALGLPLELRVAPQRAGSRRVHVPIGVIAGIDFATSVLHLPQVLHRSGEIEAQAGEEAVIPVAPINQQADNQLFIPVLED